MQKNFDFHKLTRSERVALFAQVFIAFGTFLLTVSAIVSAAEDGDLRVRHNQHVDDLTDAFARF